MRKGGNFHAARNPDCVGNFRNASNSNMNSDHFESNRNNSSDGKYQTSSPHYYNKNNYKKHGYGGTKCWKCGIIGHISKYCRSSRYEEGNFATDDSKWRRLDEYNSDSSKQSVFFESDDIALTLNSNIQVSKNEWFIDSAASSHDI